MYRRPNRLGSPAAAPPQPEWRLPARPSSGQPAPGSPASRPLPPLPPPAPPPATGASYAPGAFGPMSDPSVGSSISPVLGTGVNSRTSGRRHNQAPPPLPPRSSSTTNEPHAHSPPLVVSARRLSSVPIHESQPSAEAPPPRASTAAPPYTPPPTSDLPPPPPPKIPQESTQQGNQAARAPSLTQGPGLAASTGSFGSPPSTPLSTDAPPTSCSALGAGAPSDWEHLGPTPGDIDDVDVFAPRRTAPPQGMVETPPGYSTGLPNPTLTSQSVESRPRTDTLLSSQSPASGVSSLQQYPLSSSPVSPVTVQGMRTPPPIRVGTASSTSSMDAHSESIDRVIDAWVRPLESGPKLANSDRESPTSPPLGDRSPVAQDSLVEKPKPAQGSRPPVKDSFTNPDAPVPTSETPADTAPKILDPYEDLNPWFKSSLERYVAMLRKESVADSDEDRYKIFTAFMAKETKLREILYNIEHEPQKPLPVPLISGPASQQPSPDTGGRNSPIESGLILVESEDTTIPSAAAEHGDSGDDAESEYSLGGRPILAKRARRWSQFPLPLSSVPSNRNPVTRSSSVRSTPLSGDDPVQKHAFEPLTTNPPRPIYTPFQYTEGPQRGSDNLTFGRPADQSYSDLRQASAVSGRVISNASAPPAQSGSGTLNTSPPTNEHDATFVGLIRRKSVAYQETSHRSTAPSSLLPEPLRQSRPRNLVEELRTLVRTPLDNQSGSSWHTTTRESLQKFPDDFTYVDETIDSWEKATPARRQKLDQERIMRQEESETNIDQRFNEKEIGYADINTLEEEFRQTEARVQLEEERRDMDDFTAQVFNPLNERLQDEISTLRTSYESALHELDRERKGKHVPSEPRGLSVTMQLINEIHDKLEIRFQKRLDIALDCERRRKKAERRPLVFVGDMASLRKLDEEFDRVEKRNVLEAAKDRDDRANRLMDSFDDAILHGLGMNQSLVDKLASKTAALDPVTLRAAGLPDSEVEQILQSAATCAASLRADSEALLRSSEVADMALNDADYSVSVAEARYADAEPEIFGRLEAEKKKEDAKIRSELESKLQSIQKGPAEIEATIQRLLQSLGKPPEDVAPGSPPEDPRPPTTAPGPASVGGKGEADAEHQERLRRALENAKRRNAARNNPLHVLEGVDVNATEEAR